VPQGAAACCAWRREREGKEGFDRTAAGGGKKMKGDSRIRKRREEG
jgi:hypothetical protein